jgi:hypothetical protein
VRYQLIFDAEAIEELERLWEEDPECASDLEAIFDELEADQSMLDALLEHGHVHRDEPAYNVSKWQAVWRRGCDLWRLKPLDDAGRARPVRVLYAYLPDRRCFVVLGIVPRDSNTYDPDDERNQRLLARYREL